MQIRVKRVLRVAPETAFDFMADTRNDEQWAPLVSNVRQTKGDGPGVGATYTFTQTARGKSFPMTVQMTGCDRPHAATWEAEIKGRSYHSSMTFEGHPKGTLVRQVNSVDYGTKGLMSLVVRVVATRILRQQLARAAKVLEEGKKS